MNRVLVLALSIVFSAAACDVFLPSKGYFGLPCRGDGTCADGLACSDSVCIRPDVGGADSRTAGDATGMPDGLDATIAEDLRQGPAIWHVKMPGPMAGDGKKWATSFVHPQDAVDAASAGDEVWVTQGVYVLRSTGDEVVLEMKDEVSVYGGFAGTETELSQRNPKAHPTFLDGKGEAINVVRGASMATFDGFRVVGGDSTGHNDNQCSGMMNQGVELLVVSNCSFTDNRGFFGALCNDASQVSVKACAFAENEADYGAAMANLMNSKVSVVNCLFRDNEAQEWGGALYASNNSSVVIVNSTLYGNTADKGSAVYSEFSSDVHIRNGIVKGVAGNDQLFAAYDSDEPLVSHSYVDGGYPGTGNIQDDPLFVSEPYDLHLLVDSPCIDTGDDFNAPDIDLDGNPRPSGTGFDMGCYEYQR